MRMAVATAAVTVAATLVSAANADNYGTTPTRAKQSAELVYRAFGGGWAGACAVRIMWRESGGNPRAANYRDANGGSYGLLQLNGAHRWRGESLAAFQRRMWNVSSHLAAAVRLYRGSGFSPWRGCP